MSGDPRLSVVVPFYNVERYLPACLESIQRQTFRDFEVLLVNDGGDDGSLDIARAFARRDPRFRVLSQPNAGPGPARNNGISRAQGELLAFVDGDDLVPRGAFEVMVASLDRTGSDFAAGDARRVSSLGVRESWAHRVPFAEDVPATHISKLPELALDRMPWNKVIRRSFWDRLSLAFPAMLYEDYPVQMRLHAQARAVDVISDSVYFWREREGGDASITQRTWELANVRDRVTSAEMVLSEVAELPQEVRDQVCAHLLHIDVAAVLAALHHGPVEEHEDILALAQELHGLIPQHVRETAIPFDKIQSSLLEQARVEELRELIAYRDRDGLWGPLVPASTYGYPHHEVDLPFRTSGLVPRRYYRVRNKYVRLESQLVDATWDDGILELQVDAYLDGIAMGPGSRARVWLEGPARTKVPCQVRLTPGNHNYVPEDMSRLVVSIDPRDLVPVMDEAGRSHWFWRLMVEVDCDGIRRKGPVRRSAPGRGRWATYAELEDLWVQPQFRPVGFGVWFHPVQGVATGCAAREETIEVTGEVRAWDGRGPLELWWCLDTGRRVPGFVESEPDGDLLRFRATVDARELVELTDHEGLPGEKSTWWPFLSVDGRQTELVVTRDCGTVVVQVGDRTVELGRRPFGELTITESGPGPTVTEATWQGDVLVLEGIDLSGLPAEGGEAMRFLSPGNPVSVPLEASVVDGRFRLEVDVPLLARSAKAHAEETGGVVSLPPTPWHLFVIEDGNRRRPMAGRNVAWRLPGPSEVAGNRVTIHVNDGEVLQLLVE